MTVLQNVAAMGVATGKMANAADGRLEKLRFLCYLATLMVNCSEISLITIYNIMH